ncbi:hypothetical protein CVT25_010454 [Psilocybe cyanescens]|uniref:Uncharacterized protein n=1 Tax=Psilocybe cyanescens TaxID=93625 RepID=A0A409XQ35_PSICY|nr:hypothetical protein CVT25_010454 [Psilocybe cyanescens]
MSTPDVPFSINVQENEISGNLNSSMLFNFLMGIYTMVYGGTMYLYLSKKPTNSNRHIILSAISLLYLLCLLDFVVEWYYLNWTIVITGDTRESIFLATVGGGLPWTWILSDFLQNSLLIISDGLLIWRCYHVWGQSFWAIVIPSILLVAESGLFVMITVLDVKSSQITSAAGVILYNNILSALTFVSLGTTVITTFLIGYKIYSASPLSRSPSKRLFNCIVKMIIESAAVYALVLLLYAIDIVVPSFGVSGSPMEEAGYYIDAIVTVVAKQGMAPTILVARIATNDNHTVASSRITPISGLQFGSQQGVGSGRSGNATGGDINTSVYADDADPTPVIEVKSVSSADSTFRDHHV